MSCGDRGRHAHAENLLSQAGAFLLRAEDAHAIVDDTEQRVRSRCPIARSVGVSEADCTQIAGAFAYEGFRLKLH